jgi:7,8-dihydroneopterin aldolase/epimerase/oxygenase
MGIIRVNSIRVFAYHGCLQEEAIIGTHYLVDVAVHTDFMKAAKSDLLEDTVDYVTMNKIVYDQMAIRLRLIEHVALRILNEMKNEFPEAQKCWVKIEKLSAPIIGHSTSVSVEMEL